MEGFLSFGWKAVKVGVAAGMLWLSQAHAAVGPQIVTELPKARCEKVNFNQPVRLFKDPHLFEGAIEDAYSDLLLTTLHGEVNLLLAWPDRPAALIAYIANVATGQSKYWNVTSLQKQRLSLARPVKVCAPSEGYSDALGFILVSEWDEAVKAVDKEGKPQLRPPSTPGNRIYGLNDSELSGRAVNN